MEEKDINIQFVLGGEYAAKLRKLIEQEDRSASGQTKNILKRFLDGKLQEVAN